MTRRVGEYIYFRLRVPGKPPAWCVYFGKITRIREDKIQVNTSDEIMWIEGAYIVNEGERFQDRLI